MSQRQFSHKILYEDAADFFLLDGDARMKLSPKAAAEVCEEATRRGIFIGAIEGGHWLNPGFKPDMNTNWDSLKYYQADANLKTNNDRAIENINDDAREGYTAFIITLI